MPSRPIVLLRPGEKLCIENVAAEIGIDSGILLADLRSTLREHFKSFGVNAFNYEFSAKGGHVIYANANIGWLSGQVVDIKIQPKIPGITIGKCLGMAQVVKNEPASISHISKISGLISNDVEYTPIEYIACAFLDSLYTVIQNGLARKFDEVIRATFQSSGYIQIQEWVARGHTLPPVKLINERSFDIIPNQILHAAASKCIDLCRSSKLKLSMIQCRDQFIGVNSEKITETDVSAILLHRFNLPRKDYTRALSFALAILKGTSVGEEGADFLPSFTIDLDQLFESFCTHILAQLLKPKKFSVQIQYEISHSAEPEYDGSLYPDIVVRNLTTGKTLIIDLKNKYSEKTTGVIFRPSNPDLFQMSYYLNTLESDTGILVYPCSGSEVDFPIKGSESESAYKTKQVTFEHKTGSYRRKFFPKGLKPQNVYAYSIDLSGSMANTIRSLASLAFYIEYLTDKK
jgi:5-methylcytosine-specific restriction endonuclease McrBC regulatory subunit McrC